MIGVGVGLRRRRFGGGGFSGLLDTYSGAAAAYSLRQLSSTYSGDAIRVRRSSDNTETNIGFVNNELDTTSLESFCSGTNGFVTTWYDQSGNGNDATQSTAVNQPQIVSSGSVILENGKPAVQFDGSNDNFSVWNNTTAPTLFQDMSDAITLLSVEKASVISTSDFPFWANGVTIAEIRNNTTTSSMHAPFNIGYSNSTSGFGVTDELISGVEKEFSSTLSVAQRLTSRYINGDDLDVYINNASAISTTFTIATGDRSVSTNNSTFAIGSRSRDGGQVDNALFTGTMQEIVLYKSNLLSDNSGINTNINNFYNIY